MAKEKAAKQKKSSKGILLPLIIGLASLFACWYYWPNFEAYFISHYFLIFHSAIDPRFVLVLYLATVLLAVFVLAGFFKTPFLFLATFLPFAIYLGYCEWSSYEKTLKTINAEGLLTLLFTVFSKRT
jgi:hypothetical protein